MLITWKYTAACAKAQNEVDAILEDEYGKSQGAPLEEIAEEFMKRHIIECPECFGATIRASL